MVARIHRAKTVHLSCGAVLREGADSVLYSRVRALVVKAKNLRSGLSTIDVNTDIGKESSLCWWRDDFAY